MDENRITGTARNLGGKLEEGVGRVTGDAKAQVRGMADQAAGAAQDLYGQARDTGLRTPLSPPVTLPRRWKSGYAGPSRLSPTPLP